MASTDKMREYKQIAVQAVEGNAEWIGQIADEIWAHPELSLQEFHSADVYCKAAEQYGLKAARRAPQFSKR